MTEPRKAPTNVISVRFSDEELERVKALSAQTSTAVSTLIRRAALQEGSVAGAVRTRFNTYSGNAPAAASASITQPMVGQYQTTLYTSSSASGETRRI